MKLGVKGKDQCRFWIRALKLEDEVEMVRKMIDIPGPRKWAASPVITEFTVDEDFKFYIFIVLKIDSLGIMDGQGDVYITDKAHEEETRARRDRLADEIMAQLEKDKRFDEILKVEDKSEG